MVTRIPNEVANKQLLVGTETIPGTPAAATRRWTGTLDVNKSAALNRQMETTGGYDRLLTPMRSPSTFSGTYGEALSFESLPDLMRFLLRAGGSGVSDGETVPGYTWDQYPSFDEDNVETATLRHGVPGMAWLTTGVRFSEFTFSIDAGAAEGAWMGSGPLHIQSHKLLPGEFDGIATGGTTTTAVMTGAAWTVNQWAGAYVFFDFGNNTGDVRRIVSNTAEQLTFSTPLPSAVTAGRRFRISPLLPAGIGQPTRERIKSHGTKLFIDPYGELLGTTQIKNRLISASITVAQSLTPKRFLEHGLDEVSDIVGHGDRIVSGSVTLELNRPDEYVQWDNDTELGIRFEQTGGVIDPDATPDPTRKLARIDLARVLWDTVTPATRENNLTATFAFVGFLPDSDPVIRVLTKNTLATLP